MQTPKSAGDPPQQPAPSKPDRLHKLEDAGLEAKHDADTPFNPDIPPMSLFREVALVFLVTCVQLYTQAALGAVLAPLHIIGDDLGIYNPGELSWLIAGYSLTVGIFVLPSGRAGDIFGTKFVFLVGIAIFTVFSLILGFSVYVDGPVFFAFFRAMQGIGPAIMNPNGVALLGKLYRPGLRKRIAFSCFAAVAPSGWVIGAAFASIFAQLAWWPWLFWVQAITLVGMLALSWVVIPDEMNHQRDPDLKFDYLGAILGVSGMVLFNFCWNQAPVVGWEEPYVYAILVVSVFVIALFAWVETRVSAPLLPTSVWQPKFVCMLGSLAFGWASFGIWNFYLVQLYEQLRGATPLLATAYVTPASICGIIAAGTVSLTLPQVGPIRTMAMAMTAFSLANILVATAPVDESYWRNTFVSTIIAPFGMDMSMPAALVSASDAVPASEQGTAASLVNTVVQYSISIGLGVAATAERYRQEAGDTQLETMRAAEYTGVGFGVAGFVVAVTASLYYHVFEPRYRRKS